MTRTIGAGLLADLGAQSAETCDLFELQFSGGSFYGTTAAVDISYGGHAYQALGGNLKLGPMGESPDDKSQGMSVELSGVKQAIIAILLSQQYKGRLAIFTYAHVNPSTGQLVSSPLEIWRGYMNESWEIKTTRPKGGRGTATISTRLVSRLSGFNRHRGIRTNVTAHQVYSFATGDTFFMNVPGISNRTIYWGREHKFKNIKELTDYMNQFRHGPYGPGFLMK